MSAREQVDRQPAPGAVDETRDGAGGHGCEKSSAQAVERLARTLAAVLEQGLPQERGMLDYAAQTHGVTDLDGLAELVRDRDDACAGPLFCLLLSPGPVTLRQVEPLLAELRLDEAQTREAAERLEHVARSAAFVLPGGRTLWAGLEPGDARTFVAALRPGHNAPDPVERVLGVSYRDTDALDLRVALRQAGLDWTPERAAFVAAVLEGLVHAPELAGPTLDWALGFLSTVPPQGDVETALAERRRTLATLLGRAAATDALWARNTFETMASQGARPPHLHAPDLRRELALLDRAANASGLDAGRGAAVLEEDLGDCQDPDALLRLLGG
ncbi:hypothetical protein JCM15519_13330 [Fundidesulfovibrio butyratiphilus]